MILYKNLLALTVRRNFCVSSLRPEKFGYSNEDVTFLLDRFNDLNSISGNLIGVANKNKLEVHFKKNGHFEGLEDLLKVHGLGPKSVKRICDKLISVRGEPQPIDNSQRASTKRFRLPIITPSVTESQASIIKTVGSVNIGTNEITWAKINCISKNLEVWESYDLNAFTVAKKLDIITLVTICKEVVEKLPVCDTYVLEDLNIVGYGGGSNNGLPRHFLTAIMSTLLHQPPTGGVPSVVLIGGRAVAKWSGRLVGTEKISSQSLIGDIIIKLDEHSCGTASPGRTLLPLLYAEPSLRSLYNSSPPLVKEGLADAVLLALAFVDLAVNRRDSIEQTNR